MFWLGHTKLKSSDPTERREAVDKMGHAGNSKAVDPLTQALEDEDRHVRESAVIALGRIGDFTATRALANAVTRADYVMVQAKAAIALGRIGDAGGLVALTAAFNRQVDHLPVQEGEKEDKLLSGILQVSQLDIRQQDAQAVFLQIAATVALALTQNFRAAKMLAESLAVTKSDLIRYMIARSLKQYGMPIEVRRIENELGYSLQDVITRSEDHLGEVGVYAVKAIESMLLDER